MTHTTVTTQQFQTSAVSFVFFLEASFTVEKTTEQTREKLGLDYWLGGALTEGATTEGMVNSEIRSN